MLLQLTEALDHLRLPHDYPAGQVLPYLLASEAAVQAFCQRMFYASAENLQAAQAALPAQVRDVTLAYDDAVTLAGALENEVERNAAIAVACRIRDDALNLHERVLYGMVMTDDVKAAILLHLDHLFENRSENITGTIVSELKTGVQSLVWPYRVRVGV